MSVTTPVSDIVSTLNSTRYTNIQYRHLLMDIFKGMTVSDIDTPSDTVIDTALGGG